ncbi:hypothetical protein DPMN_134169 [Dreissena polymorpha]|uniref:Uncharacterized protein n=1 Tax=Dreissena polymorpha TaxID=45954 RepID=A0A9D4FZM4_DREPO|nr:hypothetical protein DPMN_134169 [Dreissena polymorpha]
MSIYITLLHYFEYLYYVQQTVEPDQRTTILIYDVNQTDTQAGEYFGATLYTYKWPPGEQFEYQHLLKNIKDGYPAQTMNIWYLYCVKKIIVLAN